MDIVKAVNSVIHRIKGMYPNTSAKQRLRYELILLVNVAMECCGADDRNPKMKNMQAIHNYLIRHENTRDINIEESKTIFSLLIIIASLHRRDYGFKHFYRDSETNSYKGINTLLNKTEGNGNNNHYVIKKLRQEVKIIQFARRHTLEDVSMNYIKNFRFTETKEFQNNRNNKMMGILNATTRDAFYQNFEYLMQEKNLITNVVNSGKSKDLFHPRQVNSNNNFQEFNPEEVKSNQKKKSNINSKKGYIGKQKNFAFYDDAGYPTNLIGNRIKETEKIESLHQDNTHKISHSDFTSIQNSTNEDEIIKCPLCRNNDYLGRKGKAKRVVKVDHNPSTYKDVNPKTGNEMTILPAGPLAWRHLDINPNGHVSLKHMIVDRENEMMQFNVASYLFSDGSRLNQMLVLIELDLIDEEGSPFTLSYETYDLIEDQSTYIIAHVQSAVNDNKNARHGEGDDGAVYGQDF